MDNSAYLKRWLSLREIKEILKTNGIALTRQQLSNIKAGRTKNFKVLSLLMAAAKRNEEICTIPDSSTND